MWTTEGGTATKVSNQRTDTKTCLWCAGTAAASLTEGIRSVMPVCETIGKAQETSKSPEQPPVAHPDVPGRPGEAPGTSGRPGEAGRSLWDVRKPRKHQGNSGELLGRSDSPGRTGEVCGTSHKTHVQGASRTLRGTSGCRKGFPGPPWSLVRLPRCPPSHTDMSLPHEAKWTLLAQAARWSDHLPPKREHNQFA